MFTWWGPVDNKDEVAIPQRPMMNEQSKRYRQRLQNVTSLRLNVERLECRRLLAGLNVSVTVDPSLSGNLNADLEIPAANRILYIDLNRNKVADPNEPTAITNENGQAFFDGLESGDYSIGLLTDNFHQRQISPAVVERTKLQATPLPSQWLLGSPSQSLWGLSADGILTLVSKSDDAPTDDKQVNISIVSIGGKPLSVVQRTSTEFLINYRTSEENRVAIFDTVSRELKTRRVSIAGNVESLSVGNEVVYGLVEDVTETSVVRIDSNPTGLSVKKLFTGPIQDVQAMGNYLVSLRQTASGKILELRDSLGKVLSSISVSGAASRLEVDSLTNTVVLMAVDGATVYRAVDNKLSKVAIIADAVAPIAMSSGRLIAGDRSAPGELAVWSMATWQPIGRFDIGNSDIRDVVAKDLEAVVLTNNAVHSLNLHVARPFEIALDDAEVTNVGFSIQQLASGRAPVVHAPPRRSLSENQFESIDLRELVTEANGQMLWYSVVSQPLHSSVQLSPSGKLKFTPRTDFFGEDSVTIRVHDGVSSADVALSWSILELNRPPLAMEVQIDELPEGLPAGTVIGTVAIIDPNKGDAYQVTSSDYRFRVENGKVILNEPLDFEAGASIQVDLTAIDAAGQFSIAGNQTVRLTNVAEAPEGVVLSELAVPENYSNVLVGYLTVVSPDAEGLYDVRVDDPRFKVEGNELWLVEPLNFEQASNVRLKFSIADKSNTIPSVNSVISLSVQDQNDKPQAIEINRREINERVNGAEVGLITVIDEDGDKYRYSVSDERFVVVDGKLKLVDDTAIDRKSEPTIPLTVTATAPDGSTIVQNFPLTVLPIRAPLQNPNKPVDVNGDGKITPLDALEVINYLNRRGRGTIPSPPTPGSGEVPFYPDVNGDGRVTPIDVLKIIEELNRRSRGSNSGDGEDRAGGEGNVTSTPSSSQLVAWDMDEVRRKNNARIDAELEQLLDQIVESPRKVL